MQTLGDELLEEATTSAKARREALRQQHADNRQKAEARYRPQIEQFERKVRGQRQSLDQVHRTEQERWRQQGEQALEQSRQRYSKARARLTSRADQSPRQARTGEG